MESGHDTPPVGGTQPSSSSAPKSGDLRAMWPRPLPDAHSDETIPRPIGDVRDDLSSAEAKINAGEDYYAAAGEDLRLALRYPSQVADSPNADDHAFARALSLVARIPRLFIANEAKLDVAAQAAQTPDHPAALYHLGYQLVEAGENGAAATVFARALALAPDNATLLEELASSLERENNYRAAAKHLRDKADVVEDNFHLCYQLAWLSVLCGDLGPARRVHPFLARERGDDDAGRAFLEARIRTVLARADAVVSVGDAVRGGGGVAACCPLDQRDLRGWNYVLNGGLLLHSSRDGADEGMNGRYSWVHDSEALCFEGVHHVKAVLARQGVRVPRVMAMPDPKSYILAKALATALAARTTEEGEQGEERGGEVLMWPPGGTDLEGVVVAYDLDLLADDITYTLRHRYPRQYLWAHAVCWTSPEPCVPAPDFITFLYQTRLFPWIQRCKLQQQPWDAQTDESQTNDQGVLDGLAKRLLDVDGVSADALEGLDRVLELAHATGLGGGDGGGGGVTTAMRAPQDRPLQWPRSPVPGNIWTATTRDVGVAGDVTG